MVGDIALPNSEIKRVRIGRDGDVAGDFTGTIEGFLRQVVQIGGSLTAGSLIKANTTTTNLEIVINNSNVGGEWLGDVNYDGAVLGKPQYVQTEADLDDSRSGQVPFLIHGVDSSLTFDSATPLAESFIDEVIWKPYTGLAERLIAQVRFFGSVEPDGGWNCGGLGCAIIDPAPFVFERRALGEPDWLDITHCYGAKLFFGTTTTSVIADSWPTAPSGAGPVAYRNGYEYRLRPTTDLLCNLDRLNPGSPVPVGDDAITWRVGNLCPTDLNADGVVNADDLGILLAAFGTSVPVTGDCANLPGDTNGDNIVNADDLGELLAAFGNDCGPSDPNAMAMAMAMMGGGTAVTSAQLLTALGYESAEAFAAFVAELEPADQLEAITAAWLLAQALEENAAEQTE